MNKSRIGTKLLWALIPLGAVGFILWGIWFALPMSSITDPDNRAVNVLSFLILISMIAFWVDLIAGVIFKLKGRSEIKQEREEGNRYALENNWLRITDSSWKKFAQSLKITVAPEFKGLSYDLVIQAPGDKVVTSGYERSVYALGFGDYALRTIVEQGIPVNATTVENARVEYSRSLVGVNREPVNRR